MRLILLIPIAAFFAGCAAINNQEHANTLKSAIRDDQTCQSQGWRYPDPRYVTCRMQLDDKRQYRDWMNLQIMHQTQYQNPSAPPAYPYQEVYRSLDRDRYRCRYDSEGGQDYVLCSEDTQN